MFRAVGFLVLLLSQLSLQADEVTGLWTTVSDTTGKKESVIAIYPYFGKYYGRIIATYNKNEQVDETLDNPKDRAPGVVGDPYYIGLDIIWNLSQDGDKLTQGKILDPEKGDIYDAEAWVQNGDLYVRGKIWIFGRNVRWIRTDAADLPNSFKVPELSSFVPKIPEVKQKK